MITQATHHLGFRAEEARLCEIDPEHSSPLKGMLPYLTAQLMSQPPGAKACADCVIVYWMSAEPEKES